MHLIGHYEDAPEAHGVNEDEHFVVGAATEAKPELLEVGLEPAIGRVKSDGPLSLIKLVGDIINARLRGQKMSLFFSKTSTESVIVCPS